MAWTDEFLKKFTGGIGNVVQAVANTPQAQAAGADLTPVQQQAVTEAATELAAQNGTLQPTYGDLANQYLNMYKDNKYNYDLYTDPIYKQAMESAMRQGQLASKNVQAQTAALTGGFGNSYGATAAAQQYNQYLQNANEIVPELEANAYNRWQNEQNKNMTLAQIYLDLENRDYTRQLNEAQLAAQYEDYGKLNALGIDTEKFENKQDTDRAWEELNRARQMTEWEQDDEDRATSIALQAAQFGDYTKLEELGFDMTTQVQRDALDEAITRAKYYDYSGLKALGFDVSFLEAQLLAQWAGLYGTGSGGGRGGRGGGGGGDDTDNTERTPDYTSLKTYALSMGYDIIGTKDGIVYARTPDGDIVELSPDEDQEQPSQHRNAGGNKRGTK